MFFLFTPLKKFNSNDIQNIFIWKMTSSKHSIKIIVVIYWRSLGYNFFMRMTTRAYSLCLSLFWDFIEIYWLQGSSSSQIETNFLVILDVILAMLCFSLLNFFSLCLLFSFLIFTACKRSKASLNILRTHKMTATQQYHNTWLHGNGPNKNAKSANSLKNI